MNSWHRSALHYSIFTFHSSLFVDLCKAEFVLYNQLIRSGTAIGALIHEAEFAQSKADFIHKLSIALKEANETSYWMEILSKTNCLDQGSHAGTHQLLTEIIKMLVSSVNTAKGNNS